jgi:hypothetical protein
MDHNNHKKSVYYKVLFLLFTIHYSLFTIHYSFAQENKYNEVVKIVAEYTPTISDAYKINLNPKIEDTIVEAPKLSYYINSVKMNTGFELEPIKPLRMSAEPLDKLYNSLLNVGIGNYLTPYAEFFYNSLQSKDYNAGFHFRHLSSNAKDGIKGYKNSYYSDNEVNVYGKYFMQSYTLFGDINYVRNVVHYYGHQTDFPNDSIKEVTLNKTGQKQIFTFVNLNAGITGNYHDAQHLGYEVKFKYYNLSDLFSAKENNIRLNGFVSKNVSFMSSAKTQMVMVSADISYFNNVNNFMNTGSTLYKVTPELRTDFNKLKVNIGLNISDHADADAKFRISPVINANLALVSDMLYVYSGINGGFVRNTYKAFSDANPFINSDITEPFTSKKSYTTNKIEFSGGIKGSFSKNLSFNASITTTDAENVPLFVTDTNTLARNRFTVVYNNIQITNLMGEISWEQSGKLDIMLRGDYFNYTLSNESYAWEKPLYDLSLSARYHFNEQLILKADLFGLFNIYEGKFDKNKVILAQKTDHIFDINLSGEYRFTKQLSAFLNLNNLAFDRYYRWYNYPSEKFNFLAGVSYRF